MVEKRLTKYIHLTFFRLQFRDGVLYTLGRIEVDHERYKLSLDLGVFLVDAIKCGLGSCFGSSCTVHLCALEPKMLDNLTTYTTSTRECLVSWRNSVTGDCVFANLVPVTTTILPVSSGRSFGVQLKVMAASLCSADDQGIRHVRWVGVHIAQS